MSKHKNKLPVGDLYRNSDEHSPCVEMNCRDGKHPASEISEHAFRRGFQHGVLALADMLEGLTAQEIVLVVETVRELSDTMRYDHKPHRCYWDEFDHAVRKKVRKVGGEPRMETPP